MQSLFWVRQTGCKSSAQIGSMDCVTHSAARYDLWADSNCAQHTINITHLQDVQTALITLPGVGRKVADCVALFSLDQTACVPVDVHVYVRPRFCYIMPCSRINNQMRVFVLSMVMPCAVTMPAGTSHVVTLIDRLHQPKV